MLREQTMNEHETVIEQSFYMLHFHLKAQSQVLVFIGCKLAAVVPSCAPLLPSSSSRSARCAQSKPSTPRVKTANVKKTLDYQREPAGLIVPDLPLEEQ